VTAKPTFGEAVDVDVCVDGYDGFRPILAIHLLEMDVQLKTEI